MRPSLNSSCYLTKKPSDVVKPLPRREPKQDANSTPYRSNSQCDRAGIGIALHKALINHPTGNHSRVTRGRQNIRFILLEPSRGDGEKALQSADDCVAGLPPWLPRTNEERSLDGCSR
jgi:hypothetical protein